MKNRTLYTAGLILSTLGINAQQKVGITYQVEYRDGITNERIYRTPHSVITELIDGVATATVTEIANLPKGYKLVEGQEATITQTVTKGQTNILTFRVKATDQSTKLEEGAEFRRVANGTRGFSWSAGTNPSFEYVIPENLGGFEHVRRNIDFHVSIANNPFLQGGNNNNWNYHILDFERIQQADLRDYIADSYIASRHPFIFLTTTGTTPQWGSSDNPAASRILGNTWSNNTRELQLGFDLAIHHLVPTGTYSFPIRLWYPLQQGQTYWTTPLKDELVFEVKVVNNYLKFDMEQTRLTTAANNRSQADDLAQRHTVSGTTNFEAGSQVRLKNQAGTVLGTVTVGTDGRWSATITGLKAGDVLTAEVGRSGYFPMSDTLRVEDGSAPHVPNATVSVYRGEAYPGKVLTAQDNLAVTGITTNPTNPGAGGSFSVSGSDLNLNGTAALDTGRSNPNDTVTSSYTVTARDGGNRTGTGRLTVQIKPQTSAYTATARTGLTFDSSNSAPQPASLLTVSRASDSTLPTNPANARYEFVGAGVNMNQIGEQTVKVKVTYADGSTDEVTVTVSVRDTTAPTGTGVNWTRYRGEAYGGTPFFTAEDNVGVQIMSHGQGTYPETTDQRFGTSYRRGNSSTGKGLVYTVAGNVPLNATTGTTRYVVRFADANPASNGNESGDVVSTVTIKEQTEAYTATAKTNVSVVQGTVVTEADLLNIVKSATDSSLPTPGADGKITIRETILRPQNQQTVSEKTTTYRVTSGSLDTSSPGIKNVTILVTYPDGSTDTVRASFTVTNQKPTIATIPDAAVWAGQAIQRPILVDVTDPDGTVTAVRTRLATFPMPTGVTLRVVNGKVEIAGAPAETVNAERYDRRLIVTDNNGQDSEDSNSFAFNVLKASNQTLARTSRTTPSQDEIFNKVKEGLQGDATAKSAVKFSLLGDIPTPAQADAGNNTVQVRLTTSSGESKTISITINYPPAVCTKPAITTGTALETIVGISDIRTNTDEWPHSRKGGWIALESNNKGFVINRLSTAQIRNITHPQEGMIAYDTTEKCLKIFNGTEWKCFSNPVCPQFK